MNSPCVITWKSVLTQFLQSHDVPAQVHSVSHSLCKASENTNALSCQEPTGLLQVKQLLSPRPSSPFVFVLMWPLWMSQSDFPQAVSVAWSSTSFLCL